MSQPADNRRAWTCPACEQSIHYIAGQDPITIHQPHCPTLDAVLGARPPLLPETGLHPTQGQGQ